MDLEIIILSEVNDRESQISYDNLLYVKLKKKRYKWTYLQNTDFKNEFMVTKKERWGER